MLLKLKAKIYQYTGIYLAQKECNEYLKANCDDQDGLGLLTGLWQANNGFYRYGIYPQKHYYPPRTFKRRLQNFGFGFIKAWYQFRGDMKWIYWMVSKRYYFKLLRVFNNDLPSRIEAQYALDHYSDKMALRIHDVTRLYADGLTLEEIGSGFGFTRERARQMLMKGCRYIK